MPKSLPRGIEMLIFLEADIFVGSRSPTVLSVEIWVEKGYNCKNSCSRDFLISLTLSGDIPNTEDDRSYYVFSINIPLVFLNTRVP